MIFLCNTQGDITAAIPSAINQGSIRANKIVLIAPFPDTTVVTATFTLPNGVKLYPRYVSPSEAANVPYLMAYVPSFKDGNLFIDGVSTNLWELTLDKAITQVAGNVQVQFFFTAGGDVLTSSLASLPVSRGNAYLSPSVNESDFEIIEQFLNAAEIAAGAAEDAQEAAKAAAEETKLNADRYSPWDVVATQEIVIAVLNGMANTGLKSYLFLNVDFTELNLNNFINGDGIPQINIANSIEKLEFRGCTFESAQGVPLALKFRYAGSQCSISGAKGDELEIQGFTDVIDCRAKLIQGCEYVTACDAVTLDDCESVTDTTAETFVDCIFVDPFTVIGFVPTTDNGKVPTLTDDGTYKPERLAKTIRANVDQNNYKIKIALDDVNGIEMSEAEIDLPLESVVVGATVSDDGTTLILTLQNGTTVDVPIGDIFRGVATEEWVNEKLADYATTGDVNNAVAGTATEGWVEGRIADAESRLAQQMETLPPYDVETNRVYTNYESTYIKLTIDNLLDGDYESFQPFELVCLGYDGMPKSAICTVTVEQADQVHMLVYSDRYPSGDGLYPFYCMSEDGNVYLYFKNEASEFLQVYVRGLVERCTGAVLDVIDALPDGVSDINIETHVTSQELETDLADYVKNTDYPTWNKAGVVKVVSGNGVQVTSEGQLRIVDANDAQIDDRDVHTVNPITPRNLVYAVKSVTYDKAEIDAKVAAGGGGGGNTNIDVTAEVGQTIIVKEVDANGKPTKWEAADYQEKICGEEFSELLPNTTATFVEEDGAFVTECNFDFVAGGEYIIDWNGTLYSGVAEEINGITFVGNMLALEGMGDTGEPFVVITNEGMLLAFPLDGSAELVIGVSGNKIQSIAKKFLPQGVIYGMPYYSAGTFDLKGWYSVENQLGDADIVSETRGFDGTGTSAWVNTSVNKIAFEELLNLVRSSSRVPAVLNNRGLFTVLIEGADEELEGSFEYIQARSSITEWNRARLNLRWSESDNCVQRSCVVTSSYVIGGL